MISKEEYKILLRCKDKPQEQEKGKGEEYASLAFNQLLFRMEQGSHTLYKTTYHGKKAIEEYLSARTQIRVSNTTLAASVVSVILAVIGIVLPFLFG